MRRLVVLIFAVLVATFLVSSVALSAQAAPADQQYEKDDGSEASGDTRESTTPEDSASDSNFVSQGSAGGDSPEARAAQADLNGEAQKPYYSQVVDNSTKGRFVAPGWKRVSGEGSSYGRDHVVASTDSDAKTATFKMKVPSNDDYAVYGWWTADKANASAARFVIESASGPKTEKVNETKEGGLWIRLGIFDLKKGERTVKVSPSDDANVVADAITIVRDEQAPLPESVMGGEEGGDMLRTTSTRSGTTGAAIVRSAKRWLGTKYRYGTCTRYFMSCTCETKRAVAPFGHTFPMTEVGQWRYEPSYKVRYKKNLLPGDIVFFAEPYPPKGLDHVGVYSGRGNIVHASAYFGKVVESKMRYIKGYYGAIRVR